MYSGDISRFSGCNKLSTTSISTFTWAEFSMFFPHFSPVCSCWLFPPLWSLLHQSALFHLNFLLLHLFHHFRPSLQSFRCSINTQPILPHQQKEKEPSSRHPQGLSRSATSVTLPAFLFYLFVFPLCRKETCDPFFALFPQTPPSILHLFLLYILLSFSSTSFPSASTETTTFLN